MSNLTLGSLFDGSGGFPLGGLISGITPLWASEIEPFPIRVTTKRMPWVKHLGNISTINGAEIQPVDIITFGSPCTDMSVAGKRAGLDGKQSVLFYEAIRIIKEMRCATNGKYPRFIVWENVPGAFSSNKGEDFKAVLESIAGVKNETISIPKPNKWLNAGEIVGGDYSIAWRTFDAQYWGVPQRRKRIYLVADFADRCAGKILFESEGLPGYSPQSFCSWQGIAGSAEVGFGEASTLVLNDQGGQRMDVLDDRTSTLRAKANHPPCVMFENHSQDTRYTGPLDVAPTVSATYGTGGNNQPFVTTAGFCTEHSSKSRGIGYEEEVSPTLRAGTVPAAMELNDTPKTLKIRSGCEGGGKGALIQDNKSATLSCNNDQTLFEPKAYGICSDGSNSMKSNNPHSGIYEADTSRTIDGNGGNPSCNQGGIAVVESFSLQGSMIGRKDENGPNGDGINKEVSFTLNTTDRHAVYAMTTGDFMQVNIEKAPTLAARDYKDPNVVSQPCYSIDRETFNCGKNFARNLGIKEDGVAATLNAQGPSAVAWNGETVSPTLTVNNAGGNQRMPDKGNFTSVVEPNYTVRRLTPMECGRLQGFPDFWCENLGTENPNKEDIAFWIDVFETHRKIIGESAKPKTERQIIKWLQDPPSDSAEYKMWGNGVALPCVCFVLTGIVLFTQEIVD
ncbi:DNA cytosine methyltransferase [Anaerocolumna sp. MB42-C2]|uniref:DNA cytosine methyltransferase n=1 Tax=Anaerocolumna sp. MB42-C2 TaxID=3070997 RepID=UPI0027E0A885|nr:DNA cytosine methyltransferase [Anaerocolumna sp. MB42-C2]WMJ89281.1 DNA cytosine methyltransferase [Anaerocolumna sp. MB42-C2]